MIAERKDIEKYLANFYVENAPRFFTIGVFYS